jgi:segregation and condensation protein B
MVENENFIEDDISPDEDRSGDNAKAVIEALMIATTEPLPLKNIAEIAGVPERSVKTYIDELNQEYRNTERAFEIKEIAGGFQIYTLPEFAEWVGALHKRKERLSKAALETLAIIAYHQPVIRADIEKIRGVDSTSVLDTLLQKNLIRTCGRLPSPGRPIKYGTTKEFLRYFGIKDISELPKEEDFGETVMSGYPEPARAEYEKQPDSHAEASGRTEDEILDFDETHEKGEEPEVMSDEPAHLDDEEKQGSNADTESAIEPHEEDSDLDEDSMIQ